MNTIDTLRSTAGEIRAWQLTQPGQNKGRMSDTALCARFGLLGSTKTWSRILDPEDSLADLTLDQWATNYQRVLEMIRTTDAPGTEAEDYDELRGPAEARDAVQGALRETGNRRLVIIEGPSGSGKTSISRLIGARWPAMVARTEVDETWKNSVNNMLGGLLMALPIIERPSGSRESVGMPTSAAERKHEVIRRLVARRRVVVLDEAHHLGPSTLNLQKTLINQTDSVFVILAIPTLLKKLMKEAYEEAVQLMNNRLFARIVLQSPPQDEVTRFMERRGLRWESREVEDQCCKRLTDLAKEGQWALVDMVAAQLLRGRGAKGTERPPVNVSRFTEAVTRIKGSR